MPTPHIPESLRSFAESKGFFIAIAALVALVILITVFELGALFGYHEANSSYRWGENYARNFGGPPGGFVLMRGTQMPDGHGVFGQVASISLPTFVVADPRHPEERVRVNDDTIIKDLDQNVPATSLKTSSYVVVLGDPNDQGEIEAKLIRIVPAPMSAPTTTHP